MSWFDRPKPTESVAPPSPPECLPEDFTGWDKEHPSIQLIGSPVDIARRINQHLSQGRGFTCRVWYGTEHETVLSARVNERGKLEVESGYGYWVEPPMVRIELMVLRP